MRKHRYAATAQAKAELHKSIQKAKDRMWNDYLKNLRGAKVWRAATFTNPWTAATVDTLTDRAGKQANSIIKKEKIFSLEFSSTKEHKQYFELPLAGQAHQSVSEQTVE